MKRIHKKQSKEEGYLTVYAALSLAILLSLFLALLEGIRFHTLQLESQLIADVAADSVLAEFHREMFERYGMFWLDTSYGSPNASIDNVRGRMEWYVSKNCDMGDVFLGDYFYRDFLGMSLESVVIMGAAVASDEQGSFFRESAREVIKDEIGISFLEQVSKWLETVEKHGLLESGLEEEKENADNIIEEWNGKEVQVGGDWVAAEIKNPTIPIEETKRKGILNLVFEEPEKVSAREVALEPLISHRRHRGGINQGNWSHEENETLTKRLLWQEYLMRYCGFFGREKKDCALQYQVEYLITGKNNDTDNLKGVLNRILVVREAANTLYLYSDKAKNAIVDAASTVISSAIAQPELQPVFRTAIILGWAYAESLYDVKCLLNGKELPLLKTKESWHYNIDFILRNVNEEWSLPEETDGFDEGGGEMQRYPDIDFSLYYEDYLRIFLALTSLEEQTFRMMDIVEMDIRMTPGNEYFRMDGCVDHLAAEISVKSSYGYQVKVCKKKKY